MMPAQYHYLLIILLLTNCKRDLHAEIDLDEGINLITAPTFVSYDSIKPVQEDEWYKGQRVTYDDGAVWLNPDPREVQTRAVSNIGKIIYKDKVQFKYDGTGIISFKTSFIIEIITTNPYPNCGSGMTFFIADYAKAPERSYGRYLGLVSPNATNSYRFFAVEFDTHVSEEFADPSASHIGIDINSLKSVKYVDSKPNSSSPFYPELYLYNNYSFMVWIEYDASQSLIQVWMINSTSTQRPPFPCLNLTYNLSDVFQDYMYVGFSASSNASDDSMEGHVLRAWNLTIYPPAIRSNSKVSKLLIPLLVPLSGVVLLCLCCITFYHIVSSTKKRRQDTISMCNDGLPQIASSGRAFIEQLMNQTTLMEYSYNELMLASHNFSNTSKIGEGTFSMVYKATLPDGQTVAIKRLKEGCRKELEFSSEIRIISNIRHKNLLPLLGWCYEKGEALLVYRYMSRGSLNNYLYGKDRGTLSRKMRLEILAGVAFALDYLHTHLGDCVLHRDVKAANVLLTEDFKPVLADFGLARLIRHDENSVTMTAAGSPGYVAPEVIFNNKATEKSDVYSYGVLVLVVACGHPAVLEPSASASHMEGMRLVDWVWILHEANQLMDALDFTMCQDMPELEKVQWRQVLHVALMCVNPSPKLRPTMRQVCQALQGDTVLWLHPLPAMRPTYPASPSWWRSASNSMYLGMNRWSLSVSPSDVNEYPNPFRGHFSITCSGEMSTATFAHDENCEGR